jgi:3-oxoadipate enol-lactonase
MPTVSTNGVETYYERHGDGYPIVFAHGSGWDRRQWLPQVETLADEFEVITYDIRGHGRTGGSDIDEVTMQVLADDLHELVEALDLDAPVVVGCSMGGTLSHVYAATYPDDVSAIIPLEGNTNLQRSGWRGRVKQMLLSRMLPVVGLSRIYRLQLWLSERFSDKDDPAPEATLRRLDMTKREYVLDAVERADDAEQAKFAAMLGFHADHLDDVQVPTLVLTGEDPKEAFETAAERMLAEIPDSRHERIPDGGHAANIDNPEAFNELLREFVADVDAISTSSPPPQAE